MNHEEQTLIDGLFGRLKQAESEGAPRDAQAQARIAEHLQQQPSAPYYMAQAILVQEAALKRLDEQNRQLQADLNQARAQVAATAPSSGGFLSSIFGGGARQPEPQPQRAAQPAPAPATSGGGWREPASGFGGPGVAPQQQGFNAAPQAAPARGGASSFLGGALQTAAGVAGGVMLAQGISSLFGHHGSQPQEVTEIINEAPAPASDSGWGGNDEQRLTADNGGYGNDQDGFMDTDYGDDGGGFFSDDDSFV
ncbi:ABC transporter substrate-binding protein [Pseudomonas putida]|nr:ABC transporter substrate-binding protein [Pseudomonas putida]